VFGSRLIRKIILFDCYLGELKVNISTRLNKD